MRVSISYREPAYNSTIKLIKVELPLPSIDGKKLIIDGLSKPIRDIQIETGPAEVNPSKEYSISYDVYSNLSVYLACEGTAGDGSLFSFCSPHNTGHVSVLDLTEDEISRIEDEFIKEYYESATEEEDLVDKLPPKDVIYLIRKASESANRIIQEVKSTKKLRLSASILAGKQWFVSYVLNSIGCPDNAVLIPEGSNLIPIGNNENIITLIPLKLNSKNSGRKERITEFDQLWFYEIYGEHIWNNYHKYVRIGSDQYSDDIVDDWKDYGYLDKCQVIRPDGSLSAPLRAYPNSLSVEDISYQINYSVPRLSNESIYYYRDLKLSPIKVAEIDIYPQSIDDPTKIMDNRGSLEGNLTYWQQNSDSIEWVISSLVNWECYTPPFELIEEHLSKYGIKKIEYPLWMQPLRDYINKYGYNDVSDYESAEYAIVIYLNAVYCNKCFNTSHKDNKAKRFFLETVFNFDCETLDGTWINPNWELYENVNCVKLIRLFWKTYYDKIDPIIRGFYFGNISSSGVIKLGDTVNTASDALRLITNWVYRIDVNVANRENVTLDTKPLLNTLKSALELGISPFQIISNYFRQFDNYHYDYLNKDLWDYKSIDEIVNEIIGRFVESVYNSSNCNVIINII